MHMPKTQAGWTWLALITVLGVALFATEKSVENAIALAEINGKLPHILEQLNRVEETVNDLNGWIRERLG